MLKLWQVQSDKAGTCVDSALYFSKHHADNLANDPMLKMGILIGVRTRVVAVNVGVFRWLCALLFSCVDAKEGETR